MKCIKYKLLLVILSSFTLSLYANDETKLTKKELNQSRFKFLESDNYVDDRLLGLQTQKRIIDFFGIDSRPPEVVQKKKKVVQNFNFQKIVDLIPITIVRTRARQFVANGQIFQVGGRIELASKGRDFEFEVVDVALDRVSFRSMIDGGVYDKFLDNRPKSIISNKGERSGSIKRLNRAGRIELPSN